MPIVQYRTGLLSQGMVVIVVMAVVMTTAMLLLLLLLITTTQIPCAVLAQVDFMPAKNLTDEEQAEMQKIRDDAARKTRSAMCVIDGHERKYMVCDAIGHVCHRRACMQVHGVRRWCMEHACRQPRTQVHEVHCTNATSMHVCLVHVCIGVINGWSQNMQVEAMHKQWCMVNILPPAYPQWIPNLRMTTMQRLPCH